MSLMARTPIAVRNELPARTVGLVQHRNASVMSPALIPSRTLVLNSMLPFDDLVEMSVVAGWLHGWSTMVGRDTT